MQILNFRTLAKGLKNKNGQEIKPNTIFRSGLVGMATLEDQKQLKDFNIKYIYDFRGNAENDYIPNLKDEFFRTNNYNILSAAAFTKEMFKNITSDTAKMYMLHLYGEMFPKAVVYKDVVIDIINQTSEQFLFHCAAGKDRTGIFGIILMLVLDFDIETAKTEYLKIDYVTLQILKEQFKKQYDLEDIDSVSPMFEVGEDYFNAFIKSILEIYGSFDKYLLSLGFTKEIKENLKLKYLV